MRAFLATNVIGSFAFDSDGNVLEKKLFPKKAEEIAEKLQETGLISEEEEILSILVKKGYKEVFTDKKAHFEGINIVYEENNIGRKSLNDNFRGLAVSLKWVTSQAELNEIISKVNVLKTRTQLRVERRDKIIIQAVGTLNEVEKDVNSLSEHLREWYGLHFPELVKEVQSHEQFAELVAKFGRRSSVKGFTSLAKESSGMDFSDADILEIQHFSRVLIDLYGRRKSLTNYLEKTCQEVMPNTSAVAGELLAARLLSNAGGLDKLSRMPSSTVQVLGAEKALFRHLKGQGKAPKYGLLFSHPLIQKVEKEQRGKAARIIAAKISLASKTDFFSKSNKSEEYKRELDEQIGGLGLVAKDATKSA